MIVDILTAPPAAGKTAAILNHIRDTEGKFIIASISKPLSRQSYEYYINNGGTDAIIIDSDNKDRSQSVSGALTRAATGSNKVIFITHSALLEFDDYKKLESFNLFIDEVPEFVNIRSLRFTHNVYKVLQYCEDISAEIGVMHSLVIKKGSRKELIKLATDGYKRLDVVSEQLLPIYKCLLMGMPVRLSFYDDGSSHAIFIDDSSINEWNHFESITIACANFYETFTGFVLKHVNKWKFRESPLINNVSFIEYPNTDRVDIHILTNKNWSRHIADQMTDDGTVYTLLEKQIDQEFGKDYLYTINSYRSAMSGIQVQYNPHGLNRYIDYQDIVAMFSYNPMPWQIPLLRELAIMSGLDENDLINAFVVSKYLEPVFQLCTRGNIREVHSSKKIRLVVPDMRAAMYLKSKYMPNATINKSLMYTVPDVELDTSKFSWKKRGISAILQMTDKERRAFYYFCKKSGIKSTDMDPTNPKDLLKCKKWLIEYRTKKSK